MAITLTVDDRDVLATLAKLQARMGNLRAPLQEIGAELQAEIALNFSDQRDPYGKPWAPLSAVTQARRRKGPYSGSNKILENIGRLRSSLEGASLAVTDDSLTIGTNVPYAAVHQFGAAKGSLGTGQQKTRNRTFPIPWGDIPARPFLPIRNGSVDLPAAQRASVLEILGDYLMARAA